MKRSGRFFYTLAIGALLPLALLYLLWRARRQRAYLRHWGERLAWYARRERATAPCFWIHAVSVGETRAAAALVAGLQRDYPGVRILITHTTPTGRATSEALFGAQVERCYLPYDTPGGVRRFLRRHRPCAGLIVETELWPNLFAACAGQGVPLLLVNARLSARSARRYARVPALSRATLARLDVVAAQDAADAARFRALGAPRVVVAGNLKFDIAPPPAQLALGATLKASIGPRGVFICASTREGEEDLLLAAWRKVSFGGTAPAGDGSPTPLLLLVPRHPQRFDAVAALVQQAGFVMQRRSDIGMTSAIAAGTEVLLGDSMGELFACYAAADVAFIGGSLRDFGAQNLLEACAVGVPVLLGPSTFNFAQAAQQAVACGAAQQCADAEALVGAAWALLADADERRRRAAAGRHFVAQHQGASARTLALLAGSLAKHGRTPRGGKPPALP